MDAATTWSDGYVNPHTTSRLAAEIFAYITFVLVIGLLIGILHGWTFGIVCRRRISAAATIPLFAFWLLMTAGTYGIGFFAFPAVIGFYWVVDFSVGRGSNLPHACSLRG